MTTPPTYLPVRPTTASRLRHAARRPARPAPWLVWVAAPLVAFLVAWGIVHPKVGVGLAALTVGSAIAARMLARPVAGLVFALYLFPCYTALRGVAKMYSVPIPLALVGMWPEMVAVLCLAGIVVGAIGRREKLRFGTEDLPVLVLLIAGVYGVVLSLTQTKFVEAVYGVHYSLSAFVFYFVARWARPTRRDIARLLTLLMVSYAVLAVLSLLDYALRPRWVIQLAMTVREGYWRQWDPWVFFRWYPRMQSLLFFEALWGSLSAIVSLLCLVLIPLRGRNEHGHPRSAAGLWILFALSFGCLLLSMSRGALGCWAAGVGVLLCLRGPHRRPIAAALCVAIVCGGAALWTLRGNERVASLVKRASALTDTNNSLAYDRVGQWKIVLDKFVLLPSGRGLGVAGTSANYYGSTDINEVVSDGGFFAILAEQGVPGVVCVGLALLGVAAVLVRLLHGAEGLDRVVGMIALALLAGLTVQNIGQNAFNFPYLPYVLWMLVGLFVARRTAPQPEPAS